MNKSPINRSLIHRKLDRLRQYIEELKPVLEQGIDAYRKDVNLRRQAERSLELAIMTACDINAHLVARLTGRPPVDYFDSFLRLADLGVYPSEFARLMAPAAGLRNRLQHEYNNIDDRLVYSGIAQAVERLPQYMKYILDYTSSRTD